MTDRIKKCSLLENSSADGVGVFSVCIGLLISCAFADSWAEARYLGWPPPETQFMIPTPQPDSPANNKRVPLVWIAATLSIGLLIAAVYLGARIVAARRSSKPIEQVTISSPHSVIAQPAATLVVAEPAVPKVVTQQAEVKPPPATKSPSANAENGPVSIITPQPGERYIQVGALNENATRIFVQHLRSENFAPQVAAGPKPELLRVLIGPFDNLEALNERKAKLESEGLETFVRRY
jgi:cell division septation protein DedD